MKQIEKIGRLPYNEFSEFCTGDMDSMNSAWHHWLQPKWDKEREAWLKKLLENESK